MRWVLVLAFCIAASAATWKGAGNEHGGLRVTIGYALPSSDEEDADNELGQKYWDVSPPVVVESANRCERAELSTRADTFFNGERGFGSRDGPVDTDLRGAGYRFEGTAEGPGDALAGESVRITATARCVSGDSVTTATARREFELPAVSCDQGPLRVGELEGRVTAVDWDHEEQGERLVQAGFLLSPASEVKVERGGHLEIGAPECNGFRMTLYEGKHDVGSYLREGRGDSFTAERAVAEGNSHAGGVNVPHRATVWPLGFRCRGCHATGPSSYEVRSTLKRATVRVLAGAVLVGGPEGVPTLRVPAGYQASVLCSAGTCRAGNVRLFQANEPWWTPPEGIVDRLPRSVMGASPPLSAFAPSFSDIDAKRLPAAGHEPEQIVIAWSRQVRRADGSYFGFVDTQEQGLLGWQRVEPERWELVYKQPVECCPLTSIETSDVTGDGHLDALTRESQGSGGCGFARVLISSKGRLREEFAHNGCDYSMTIEKSTVVLKHGVGPCPVDAGAHCSGGTRTIVKHWDGSKLVTSTVTVVCVEPRLDPTRGCRPK